MQRLEIMIKARQNKELIQTNECVPGCVCPEGKAEDDSGNCVLTENCPCLYAGSSYAKGKEIQLDCSQCKCQGGSWSCTDKPCPKTCQVYGEGHYITFDDFRFTFEGNCEYIFVQGEEIHLEDGKVNVFGENTNSSCTVDSYSLHTVGLYLSLTFTNGITVIWDKHTRFSVTLDKHWKVDPNPYYEACLQEACACDKEGKYLGFCTAVAVYAEACNKAGVCIRWRTPERCPVYCDYYNDDNECSWHYKPCGTLTAKTCSDHTIKKKLSAVIEGCYPKCPETAPYLDENIMKCVRLHQCTCLYNGQIYHANENIIGCGNW
ncbi:mucin-19-like [Leucoraja erinacea]|uniref:mucin-19-like n=1 Tax=Leucoraja erinaceus TaxID=7782 RepID=UPI0024552E44|nr:mucin-19-like [Leucoraja erinacea]